MFRHALLSPKHHVAIDALCVQCSRRMIQKIAAVSQPLHPRIVIRSTTNGIIRAGDNALPSRQPLTYLSGRGPHRAERSLVARLHSTSHVHPKLSRSYAAVASSGAVSIPSTTTKAKRWTRDNENGSFFTQAQLSPRRRRRRKENVNHTTEEKALPLDASSTLSSTASKAPPRSMKRIISTYLALTKPRLAFLIVLTTTAAYSIYPVPAVLSSSVTAAPSLSTLTLVFLTTGTFLTIASANTLNMLFEPQHDAKMSRTQNRPLVRGLLSKRAALVFAMMTGMLGTGILWLGVNPTTSLLGAGNLILYAFMYTPLKRLHPINTWVGAVVGAIPPLMGWCAAGSQYSRHAAPPLSGDISAILEESRDLLLTEQAIGGWLLAALLFAWQFPHFFALSYGVRKEYAGAGYRMLTSTNIPMAARVSLRYSMLMFPICSGLSYYNVTEPAFAAMSSVINAWMLREAWRFWRLNGAQGSARALFWASVWQLPIALVLAMIFKKDLLTRVINGIVGHPEELEHDEEDEED